MDLTQALVLYLIPSVVTLVGGTSIAIFRSRHPAGAIHAEGRASDLPGRALRRDA